MTRIHVHKFVIGALLLCGAVVVCISFSRPGVTQSTGPRRITNTSEEGINLNPSLSGDGRVLAFESTEDLAAAGGSDHLRAIHANITGEPAAFFQLAVSRAIAPAISQDGSHIAFASKDDPLGTNSDGNSEIFLFNGLSLIQITDTSPGSLANRITNGNFQPSISDDGRFIAFSSNRDLVNQNADGNLEIFVYDAVVNSFVQLTNSSGILGCSDAKICGDASTVAYIRDNGVLSSSRRDLIRQMRGTETAVVVAANVQSLALTYGRAISEDGSRIVYSAETAANATQVFMYDGRNGGAIRQITSLGARVNEVPLHPTISGDGSRIAFASRRNVVTAGGNSDGSVELYSYDLPTATFSRLTSAPSTATAEVVSSLNDDGSAVAFNFPRVLSGPVTNSGTENNSEIYVMAIPPRPLNGTLTAVLNQASLGHDASTAKAVAPDSIVVAEGTNLAGVKAQSQPLADGTFPTNVGGTRVTVNGRPAEIFFVSPTEVNFLVPPETEIATAEVLVFNPEGFASSGTVSVSRTAPGIFTRTGDGVGEGLILNSDTLQSGPFDPTGGNLRLTIFATGVRHAYVTAVSIAGRPLSAEAVIASPGLPGLDEVHVHVPTDLRGAGGVHLSLICDGRESNSVTLDLAGDSSRAIFINEVLADPPDGIDGDANHDGRRDGTQDEFVELVNGSDNETISLSGWTIRTRPTGSTTETTRFVFPAATSVTAGEAVVVFGGGTFNPNDPLFGCAQVFKASSPSSGLSLTNSGLTIVVRDAAGNLITQFSYGAATGLDGNRSQSLTRSPDITGAFVLHTTLDNPRRFSPGLKVDGIPFGDCAGHLTTVTISPASTSLTAGQGTEFTARAFDEYRRPLTGVTFSFTSDNPSVATVDSSQSEPATGIAIARITGRNQGSAHIQATVTSGRATLQSPAATVTVVPKVSRIDVAPSNQIINRGNTQVFTATAFDQNDQPLSGVAITWNSDNPNVATIDTNGLARGIGIGYVAITASTPDGLGSTVSGSATLAVQVPLVINEMNGDVAPDNPATTAVEGDANRDGVRNSDDDEFIELLNNSNSQVDLSGIIMADATSNRFTFPANTTLAGGRAVVIFGGGNAPANDPAFGGALIFTAGSLSLNDSGDTVSLKLQTSGADVLIASQTYGGSSGVAAPNDQSLTRSPDTEIGATGGSFIAHNAVTNASGRTFSPGTRADGTPFGSPPLTRIEVSPGTARADIGTTTSFTAHAFADSSGTEAEIQNVSFAWDSSDASKASLAANTGRITTTTALTSGNTTIRARAGSQQGTALLAVNPIINDDSAVLSISDVSRKEGDTGSITFSFTVNSSLPAPSGGIAFDIATQDGTAVAPADYTPRSLTNQIISEGQQSYSFDVTVNGDTLVEPDELFLVKVTSANGNPQATGTISNDDFPNLVISQVYGGGNNSGASFRNDFVEIFNRGTTTIDFALTPYSIQYASVGSNFGSNKTNLTTGSIPPRHYFLVQESGGTTNGVALPSPDATGTIGMASTAGKVALVAGTTTLSTAACSGDDGISPFNPQDSTLVDFLGYGDTTTTAGHCYEGSGPAAAPSNTTAALRRAGGCTDTNENAADFLTSTPFPRNLNSTNICGGTSLPDLAIDDVKVTEGDSGTTTATFTASLSAPAQGADTVFDIATADGTATTANADYVAKVLKNQVIPAGQTAFTFRVSVNGDTNVEPDETFFVHITNVVGANLADGDGMGTIENDDLPTVSINDVSMSEGNAGARNLDFTVSLSAPAPAAVTFDIATADGTATVADNDYVANTLTRQTIAAGQQTYHFLVVVNGDANIEANETLLVNLTHVTGATVARSQGQGTIVNDDTPLVVISQIYGGGGNTSVPAAVYKDDFIEIFNRGTTTVDLAGWSVQYNSAGGTGNWSVTQLCPSGPCLLSPGRYFLIQEGQGTAGTQNLPAPDATGTIALATTSGKVALVTNTTALSGACPLGANVLDLVGYGGSTSTSSFCYEGSGPTTAPSNVNAVLRKSDGCIDSDDNASDFASASANPRNAAAAINDCNAPSLLSIDDVTQTEGNSSTRKFTFTVTLSKPAIAGGVTFDIATSDGTATAGSDYVANSLTSQTIPAGQQLYTFDVTVNGDTTVESDETFFVNVTNVAGATVSDGQGLGTIQNDDTPALTVVISQIYAGGGNSGATYVNDFVEIFNRTATAIDLSSWSIQTATATGTTWNVIRLCPVNQMCMIGANKYYLIQLGSGGAVGSALPIPDATGSTNLATTGGKVALVTSTTALSGSVGGTPPFGGTTCPNANTSSMIDFVGYGSATCFEGTAAAPAQSNIAAIFRASAGCVDLNVNSSDFSAAAPNPRNSGSVAHLCP